MSEKSFFNINVYTSWWIVGKSFSVLVGDLVGRSRVIWEWQVVLPDGQGASGLLGQVRGVDEHQLEKQLKVADVACQPGADHPHPVPALALATPSEVDHHCT